MMNNNQEVNVNNQNAVPVVDNQFKIKKKPNLVIIIVVVLAVILIGYNILTKVNFVNNSRNGEDEEYVAVEVDTGESWGDKYALYAQNLFNQVESFEITYVDFNGDDMPEAVLKYSNEGFTDIIKILMINNNEVNETKLFHNASFKLLYSNSKDDVNWYIFIKQSGKFGAYTLVSKLMNNTALDSDIKATTEKELTAFNTNYVVSSYDLPFYKIELKTLDEDFKLSVSKYKDIEKNVDSAITKLLDENEPTNNQPEFDTSEYITVGDFKLHYGEYTTEVSVYENGEEVGKKIKSVFINRDGTIKDGESIIKFTVYSTSISLESGITFKVTGDDKFNYGTGDGLEYTLKSSN